MFLPPIDTLVALFTGSSSIIPIIRAIEKKCNFRIGMHPKTIKKALSSRKNTPQTEQKLDLFLREIDELTEAPYRLDELIEDQEPFYSYWPYWLAISKYTDKNFPQNLYPQTRMLIQNMSYWERDILKHTHEKCRVIDRIRTLVEDESRKNWVPDKIRQNLLASISENADDIETDSSFKNNYHFELWIAYSSISTILRVFAWFDVEYTQGILEANEIQGTARNASFMHWCLPRQHEQKVILPIKNLFEHWRGQLISRKKVSGSWKSIAEHIKGNDIQDKTRMLYSWLSGEHIPSDAHIKHFLESIQSIDESVDWLDEYKWYKVAAAFQRLYQELRHTLLETSKEETLLPFEAFKFHRKEALNTLNL
ncbi:hypothetical protein DBB_17870 [Desulfoluna spongiiphila]|nr:hypothetical protein DBB_17870 [Desulfoluna spongiiphila]